MTVLYTIYDPPEIMEKLVEIIGKEKLQPATDRYSAVGTIKTPERPDCTFKVSMATVNEDITCVRFQKKTGDRMDFLQMFAHLRDDMVKLDIALE